MKKNRVVVKVSLTIGVSILMVYAIILGNEIILPSAMVVWMMLLGTFRKTEESNSLNNPKSKSFHYAVITFGSIFAILNVCLSLFFPSIAQALAVDGLYDGEFVRVTINDAHEFCYAICLLLLIENGFYFGLRRRKTGKLILQKQ